MQRQRPETSTDLATEATGLIGAWRNRHATSGLAVALVRGGEPAWSAGFGLADVAAGTPVTPATVFRAASITKTLVAVAVAQLVQDGTVALDDPVNAHLRAWRLEPADPAFPPVTIRHLLTHTGGIGELRRGRDVVRPMFGLGQRADRVPPELTAYYGERLAVQVAPGTKWAYANHGYATLGQMVEDVTGEPLAERLRTRVLDPFGMASSDLVPSARVTGRLAKGYALGRRGLAPVTDLWVAPWPAGSLYATADDLAAYAAGLLAGGKGPGGKVLEPAAVRGLLAPAWRPDDRLAGMGLGFMLDQVGSHRVAGHDGGWPGFISSLLLAPDDGAAVVVLTNGGRPEVATLANRLLRLLLGAPASAIDPTLPDRPEVWRHLRGWYAPAPGLGTNARVLTAFGGGVEVGIGGDQHLRLSALSPVPALRRGVRLHPDDAEDPLLYRFEAPELGSVRVAFHRSGGGPADALHMGSGYLGTMHRRPAGANPRLWLRAAAVGGGLAAAALALRRE